MKHKIKGNRRDGKVTGRVVKANGGIRGNSRYDGRRVWLAQDMEFLTTAHIGLYAAANDNERKELAKIGIPYMGFAPKPEDVAIEIPQEMQDAIPASPDGQ